jgi:hypothetical protein
VPSSVEARSGPETLTRRAGMESIISEFDHSGA